MKPIHAAFATFVVTAATLVLAASAVASPANPVTQDERTQVLDALARVLATDYFDPERGREIAAALRTKVDVADPASKDPEAFAAQITTDLLAASEDLHFLVLHDPDWVRSQAEKGDPEVERRLEEAERGRSQRQNHGFRELRILEGNIGYLNLTFFADPEHAHEAVSAAMKLLSGTDGLILDLRFNNGGYLETAQLLCSYFLPSSPSQMLFDYYDLEEGRRIERRQWVLPSVSGKRMLDTPLYVLTSNASFSAAEWLAFILKNLGRATVIGEVTAGGAHPVNRRALNQRFVVQVPTGEIKDGVLGKDFEGTGVTPDLEASAETALHVAHLQGLKDLLERESEHRAEYAWFQAVVEARLHPPELDAELLGSLAGFYGSREVQLEGGKLYYSWNGEDRVLLRPIDQNVLAIEGIDDFRFLVRAENGRVQGLERLYMDGRRRFQPKTR